MGGIVLLGRGRGGVLCGHAASFQVFGTAQGVALPDLAAFPGAGLMP